MRNPFLNNPLRDKVRPKFRGKQTLAPRQDPRFPDHLVRDYDRITNAAMALVHRLLRQKLPQIRRLFEQSTRLDADGDTTFDTLFFDLTVEFERDFLRFGLAGKLAALAERNKRTLDVLSIFGELATTAVCGKTTPTWTAHANGGTRRRF